MDFHVPGLHLRADLLAAGFTSGEVQRERRTGSLVSVRRGAYVRPEDERLQRARIVTGCWCRPPSHGWRRASRSATCRRR